MKLALVQFSPIFGDVESNNNKIFNYCNSVDCDIIVFPELATSGYDFLNRKECMGYSLDLESEFFSPYKELAATQRKLIVIGYPERQGNKVYNSAALIFPDNKFNATYRKTHLFYRERFVFDENDKGFFVINYPDFNMKLGTMICYDWRFPEVARSLALLGADLIVCPSNLVTKVWDISMPARALDNKVYLAVANRTGGENRNGNDLVFTGESKIYSYNGTIMAEAGKSNEEVIIAEIDPKITRKKSFNEFNDIFTDRRPQFYKV